MRSVPDHLIVMQWILCQNKSVRGMRGTAWHLWMIYLVWAGTQGNTCARGRARDIVFPWSLTCLLPVTTQVKQVTLKFTKAKGILTFKVNFVNSKLNLNKTLKWTLNVLNSRSFWGSSLVDPTTGSVPSWSWTPIPPTIPPDKVHVPSIIIIHVSPLIFLGLQDLLTNLSLLSFDFPKSSKVGLMWRN